MVQAALVVGYFIAASHLCFQEKEKGGKILSTVNLNTCKKSSWDLFHAGPTGVSPRWRWGQMIGCLRKDLTQPPCFLPAAVLRILIVNLFEEDMLSFDKRNTTWYPFACTHNAGTLTTTTPKNSAK